ncbi:hypothetical protein [Lichenibacterium dinghuense]|uniref:hypothetical protein n=1 Tax=Lichenibacterium dinghuense TaxID=2895977 RepID=UPI001F471631|nr:hypothetical protein [Lichenibacterium sp. 6Y81]
MTDAPPPKRGRGRPPVYATPELALQAARDRATAHTQARRRTTPERTIALAPERVAQGDEIIRARGLDGWSHLVAVLIEDEVRRRDGDL